MKHNAIVLHKIVVSNPVEFEDVFIENFIYILELTKNETILTSDLVNTTKSSFLITIDDGFKSDYNEVLPLLIKYKAKAIFFIVPDFIGQKEYLTWEQVRKLSEAGMEIGSHSLTHPNFKELSFEERVNELKSSKKIIEKNIGKSINSFSIPFGFSDVELEKLVIKCGYSYCFTSKHGLFHDVDMSIPRNSINAKMDIKEISKTLYPSMIVKLFWNIEDFIKPRIKFLFGNKYYYLRNKILNL